MSVLFRYLLREYLRVFGFCLSGLFIVFFAVHFFEKMRRYARYDPSIDAIAQYFLLRIPQILLEITPLAVLMAAVLTLGLLSRHNEIIAMKGAGVSPFQILFPFLLASLVISGFLLMLNLSVIPLLKQQTQYVNQVKIRNRPPEIYFRQSRIWMRAGPLGFMNIQLADSRQSALFDVNIYRLNPNYSLSEMIEAKSIRFEDGRWVVYDGLKRTFLADGRIEIEKLDQAEIMLDRQPAEFIQIEKDADLMTYQKLADYASQLEKEGYDAQRYWVDLYTKTALPFIPFVFTMIGAPLGLHRGIGKGVSRGIGISLMMAGLYWMVFSLCVSFGYGQILPPLISAWSANGLFGLIGIYLMIEASH